MEEMKREPEPELDIELGNSSTDSRHSTSSEEEKGNNNASSTHTKSPLHNTYALHPIQEPSPLHNCNNPKNPRSRLMIEPPKPPHGQKNVPKSIYIYIYIYT